MPTLKQITCSVQLGPSDTKLKEYGHRFTDGGVEAFIAVPDTKIPFNVRVTSSGYIAPGLAAYVFMDGQYQCNRNRQRLQLPAPGMSTRDYEVDFRLRQKEEKTAQGTFVAREWTFAELKTGNADKAPDTNPAFAKNVGTIEVVILRCKGDSTHNPAETVIDGGGEIGVATTSRAPSVAHSAPAAKARSNTKPASKAPSKAPSNQPSAADDDGMGGMSGLFDGAGDDPGYGRRMPGYYDDRAPLPQYRRDVRDDNPYSPRPFTVHGGGNRNAGDQRARAYNPRPRTADDGYAPPDTPHLGYDFQQRRGYAPEAVQQSPLQRQDPRPYQNAYTPRAPPSSLLPRVSPPEGFEFILNTCKEIDGVYRSSFGERQKAAELAQEARAWESDPEMHLSVMKALRYKQQELHQMDEQLTAMRETIYASMRRMNPKTWQYTRDFLVLEARLFDPNDPQMQQWPDPRLQQHQHLRSPDFGMTRTSGAIDDRTGPGPRSNDGWVEVGQGETGGGLQQRQMRKQSGAQFTGDGWGAKSQKGNNNWATDDVDAQASNKGNEGGSDSGSKKAHEDNAWDKNDNRSGSKNPGNSDWADNGQAQSNAGGNDGWSTRDNNGDAKQDAAGRSGDNNNDSNSKASNAWPDDKDGGGSQKSGSKKGGQCGGGGNDNANQDSWAQRNEDNRSQTSKSKIEQWNYDDKRSKFAAGRGTQSKAKSRGGGGDWEQVGAGEAHARSHASSRRPARTTTSVALEPVIKPYWADWNKPQQDTTRPRLHPRDPYEYPRPETVLAPSGRARDVSHGVQAGRGADYAHKTFRPEYLDTMDKPYAIFTFKYRSQSALEKILQRRIDTSDTKRAVDEAEKEKLMRLPKDELVQEMLRMKSDPPKSGSKLASAAKAPSNPGWEGKTPSQANNDWGGDHERDDVKPSDSVSNHTAKRSNRGDDAWGADNNKRESSRKSQADAGKGGDTRGKQSAHGKKSEKKDDARKPKSKVSAWDAAPAAGGDDAWGAFAGDNTWEADKGDNGQASSKSEEHFAGDKNMKATGDQNATGNWPAEGW